MFQHPSRVITRSRAAFLILTLSTLPLIGCSNARLAASPDFTVSAPKIAHPARPNPLRLEDAHLRTCGSRYCLTPADAKKQLRNKAQIGRYIGENNAVIDYYEKATPNDDAPINDAAQSSINVPKE